MTEFWDGFFFLSTFLHNECCTARKSEDMGKLALITHDCSCDLKLRSWWPPKESINHSVTFAARSLLAISNFECPPHSFTSSAPCLTRHSNKPAVSTAVTGTTAPAQREEWSPPQKKVTLSPVLVSPSPVAGLSSLRNNWSPTLAASSCLHIIMPSWSVISWCAKMEFVFSLSPNSIWES